MPSFYEGGRIMYCQKCGAQSPDYAKFCAHCGEPFQAAQQTAYQQPAPNYPPPPAQYYPSPPSQQPPYGAQPPNFYAPQVKNSPVHWLSVILVAVAFFFFAFLGGDPDIEEVNIFDYVAFGLAVPAVLAAFLTIPKQRKGLYITSIILSILMLLGTAGWAFF